MSTLVLSIGGILGLFALIAFASKSYSLNGIKDTTVGNGQHGTARWATPGEIKQSYRHVTFAPVQWRREAQEGNETVSNGTAPQGDICVHIPC